MFRHTDKLTNPPPPLILDLSPRPRTQDLTVSLPALTAYLSLQEPGHTIDSAYALEQKYRLAAQTVISQLHAHYYTYTPIPPTPTDPNLRTVTRTVWVKQETQLDRIERKLNQLLHPSSHA